MEAPWVQLREDSHGIPMVIPMGIPTEILWEWDGNGNGNSIPTATLFISQCVTHYTILYMEYMKIRLAKIMRQKILGDKQIHLNKRPICGMGNSIAVISTH